MPTLDKTEIELNPEQAALMEHMEKSSAHMFITGKAGTGKSTLLHEFKNKTAKQVALVAPTGVAALNIGGQTIHSLFRIKPTEYIEPGQLRTSKETKDILSKIDTLIIDEVSMVRADLMDAIDHVLQFCKRSSAPFGGVQIIMFGDLFQLPPVIRAGEAQKYFEENYGGVYFFNANVWQESKLIGNQLEIHELQTNIRQENDQEFARILNSIRKRELNEEYMQRLNERARFKPESEGYITLALTNKTVNDINQRALKALSTKEKTYKAQIEGRMNSSEYPTDAVLKLKMGAQVMMLKNDRERRYANGSIGTVVSLSSKSVVVDIEGEEIEIKAESWDKISYSVDEHGTLSENQVSSFKQLPIKLAWAITVHKSQGQTLDNVVLDMGYGAFAHGQTYVALSRCRSLESLYLKKPIRARDVIIDEKVLEFLDC